MNLPFLVVDHTLCEFRTLVRPWCDLLERGGGLQHTEIVEAAADDLQAYGQTATSETARHAGGRVPGHVERIGELRPRQPVPVVLWPMLRHQQFGRERGNRNRGRQQEVPIIEPAM